MVEATAMATADAGELVLARDQRSSTVVQLSTMVNANFIGCQKALTIGRFCGGHPVMATIKNFSRNALDWSGLIRSVHGQRLRQHHRGGPNQHRDLSQTSLV